MLFQLILNETNIFFLFNSSSSRNARGHGSQGQVPSLLRDSVPPDVTAEDREMESFLDDGIRYNFVSNDVSSPKYSNTPSNGRCRPNGNSVDERTSWVSKSNDLLIHENINYPMFLKQLENLTLHLFMNLSLNVRLLLKNIVHHVYLKERNACHPFFLFMELRREKGHQSHRFLKCSLSTTTQLLFVNLSTQQAYLER